MQTTIEEILQREEGQTFDRKSIHIKPKDLAIAIVAMANADGGDLAVGISDGKRSIEGVDNDIKHLNEIRRTPYDFCIPSVNAQTELVSCIDMNGNCNHILLFHIEPGLRVYANQADEVFLRVGDKSKKLTFDERFQLMNDKGQSCYEESYIQGAEMDDIDLLLVDDYCKQIGYGKNPMDYLSENHGFLIKRNEIVYPSVVTILLFGKRPQDFLPRACIRFIRYEGTEEKVGKEMNVIKDIPFEGTLLNQIRQAVSYLATQIKERTYLGPHGTFVTEVEYPEFVRQEMIVNAVCHRDYSIIGTDIQIKLFDNRLVVESPGNLPGLVKPNNIRHTHFSRNPRIAHFLKVYKFVKEFGEGVDRMCNEMEADGMMPIKFYKLDFILQVIAWNRTVNVNKQLNTDSINTTQVAIKPISGDKSGDKVAINERLVAITWAEIQEKCTHSTIAILEYLQRCNSITNEKAREITGLSPSGVRKILTNLVENKIIKPSGSNRNRTYSLAVEFIDNNQNKNGE